MAEIATSQEQQVNAHSQIPFHPPKNPAHSFPLRMEYRDGKINCAKRMMTVKIWMMRQVYKTHRKSK